MILISGELVRQLYAEGLRLHGPNTREDQMRAIAEYLASQSPAVVSVSYGCARQDDHGDWIVCGDHTSGDIAVLREFAGDYE